MILQCSSWLGILLRGAILTVLAMVTILPLSMVQATASAVVMLGTVHAVMARSLASPNVMSLTAGAC